MMNERPIVLALIGLFLFSAAVMSGCGMTSQAPPFGNGKISGDFLGCATGVYPSGEADAATLYSYLSSFESITTKECAVAMWYVSYAEEFPADRCNAVRSKGAIPMVTWEFWLTPVGITTLEMISTGSLDAVIADFAADARSWGHRMFLRPMHEMNGNWYPWSGTWNGGAGVGTAEYIAAWRHIYSLFVTAGAGNVTFVWSPNSRSVTDEAWNEAVNYYPGYQYVDWIGIDGYNFTGTISSSWEWFADVFGPAYSTFEAYPKPLMISEFSCADGSDKDSWITDAFDKIKNTYTAFKVFVWFNRDKRDVGEPDWRVNSDPNSLLFYQDAMKDGYFRTMIP